MGLGLVHTYRFVSHATTPGVSTPTPYRYATIYVLVSQVSVHAMGLLVVALLAHHLIAAQSPASVVSTPEFTRYISTLSNVRNRVWPQCLISLPGTYRLENTRIDLKPLKYQDCPTVTPEYCAACLDGAPNRLARVTAVLTLVGIFYDGDLPSSPIILQGGRYPSFGTGCL